MRGAPKTSTALSPWWHNVWIRAWILHPLYLGAPTALLGFMCASSSGSDGQGVAWAFGVIALGALGSFVWTCVMAARTPLSAPERIGLVVLGFSMGCAVLLLSLVAAVYAGTAACHGTYECPA